MANQILIGALNGIARGIERGLEVRQQRSEQAKIAELKERELDLRERSVGQKTDTQLALEALRESNAQKSRAQSLQSITTSRDRLDDNMLRIDTEIGRLTENLTFATDDAKPLIADRIKNLREDKEELKTFRRGLLEEFGKVTGSRSPIFSAQQEVQTPPAETPKQTPAKPIEEVFDQVPSSVEEETSAVLNGIRNAKSEAEIVRLLSVAKDLNLPAEVARSLGVEGVNVANALRKADALQAQQREIEEQRARAKRALQLRSETGEERVERVLGGVRN